MSLVVSNNVASLTAQHNLFRSSSMLSQSLERLSSGYRVNRAVDGPAGLVISEQQRIQIAGLEKAIEHGKGVRSANRPKATKSTALFSENPLADAGFGQRGCANDANTPLPTRRKLKT